MIKCKKAVDLAITPLSTIEAAQRAWNNCRTGFISNWKYSSRTRTKDNFLIKWISHSRNARLINMGLIRRITIIIIDRVIKKPNPLVITITTPISTLTQNQSPPPTPAPYPHTIIPLTLTSHQQNKYLNNLSTKY